MLSCLGKLLTGLLGLVVILILIGLALPQQYAFSRSVVIEAPPERVWTHVGDLDNWPAWSPWKDGDPSIEITPGPQNTGVGASQSWIGDSGDGQLVFTNWVPNQQVAFDLEMRGGQEKAQAVLALRPQGGGTEVTWSMSGEIPVPVIGGYFARFVMPALVGPMFELGLEKLKTVAETPAEPQALEAADDTEPTNAEKTEATAAPRAPANE